jgi:hypothetical protein
VVDFCEGLGLVGDLKAFAELQNMEDIMELEQFRWQFQFVGHLSAAL